jgi:hypothetical protein
MNTDLISGRTPEFTSSQRGLVVIELAITLPLIVLIMFATAELGRAFFQFTTLTKAVQAGTRYYSSDQSVEGTGKIENVVVYGTPKGSGDGRKPVLPGNPINVTVDKDIDGDVRVTATYRFEPMLGATLPIVGEIAGFTMNVSHTMRAL